MSTTASDTTISPRLQAALAHLRGRVRRYIWQQGLAHLVAAVAVCFWVSLAVDWLWEPAPRGRVVLLSVLGCFVLAVFFRSLVLRLLTPLSDRSMAVLLERRFRDFRDSLLTSVELREESGELAELGRAMLSHTRSQAEAQLDRVQLGDVFRAEPLRRALAAALIGAASVGAFAFLADDAFAIWKRRVLTFSREPWPRATRLIVEGFESGEVVVARGSGLQIRVLADTSGVVPATVRLTARDEEGYRQRYTMVRSGNALPGQDPHQEFTHEFSDLKSSLVFEVVGGDARIRDLKIRVVDSPALDSAVFGCVFPDYMRRTPRDLPATGAVQTPRGTQLTLRGRANKPLVRAELVLLTAEGATQSFVPQLGADPHELSAALPPLLADAELLLTLHDQDGIANKDPIRIRLFAVLDAAPELKLALVGIGSAITPQARLPLAGAIRDDYGVARLWYELRLDEQPPRDVPLALAPRQQTELAVDEALDLQLLPAGESAAERFVQPGQSLVLAVAAEDEFHLAEGDEPQVGRAQVETLAVVTPDELRAMLEAKELNQRLVFEAIIERVTDTRDLLSRVELTPSAEVAEPTASAEGEPAADDAPAAPSGEAGAPPAEDPAEVAERLAARRRLRVQQSQSNTAQSAAETLGVASAFDGILAELVNNRLDTTELMQRLRDGIAAPLRQIATAQFPQLDETLQQLEEQLADPAAAEPLRQAALRQHDAILIAMDQIRSKMLELETFNEAVELLRQIIAQEETLLQRTLELRQQELRDLLDEDESGEGT